MQIENLRSKWTANIKQGISSRENPAEYIIKNSELKKF